MKPRARKPVPESKRPGLVAIPAYLTTPICRGCGIDKPDNERCVKCGTYRSYIPCKGAE